MNIRVCTKEFLKEKKEVQEAIISAVSDLIQRICVYKEQKIDFERIFNDDCVKYDKHGDFYTFKCHKDKFQLRILYAYLEEEGEMKIFVVDYFIKKKNNKKYIKMFEGWKNIKIEQICQNVYCTVEI